MTIQSIIVPVFSWIVVLMPLWLGWFIGKKACMKSIKRLLLLGLIPIIISSVFLSVHSTEGDPHQENALAVFVVLIWLETTFVAAHFFRTMADRNAVKD